MGKDKFTVVVFRNYDPNKKENEAHVVTENCEIALINAGIKDKGLIRTNAYVLGNYEDITRAYLGIGAYISRKFNESLKCHDDLDNKPNQDVRTCKSCGCTDLHACPGGCHWVTDDLCSNCVYKVIVEKGYKAHAGTYYQETKTVIAEEVISLEEVEAMIYGYASALDYEHWYDGEWNDDIEDIKKGTEVLRFDINKGEEIQHVYFYKKQ